MFERGLLSLHKLPLKYAFILVLEPLCNNYIYELRLKYFCNKYYLHLTNEEIKGQKS